MTANISQFLDIFKQAVLGDENFKETVCAIVLETTKFSINKSTISLKNQNLYLKTDPYTKTEIGLHKEKILEKLKIAFPDKTIKDIF